MLPRAQTKGYNGRGAPLRHGDNTLVVHRQRPEWVGAAQKEFAWWLGFGLAAVSCATMGLFAAPLWLTLTLCGLCLSILFLETAFGICVGCALQSRFGRTPPRYCPGDSCAVDAA